jgi:hypothetical protein
MGLNEMGLNVRTKMFSASKNCYVSIFLSLKFNYTPGEKNICEVQRHSSPFVCGDFSAPAIHS